MRQFLVPLVFAGLAACGAPRPSDAQPTTPRPQASAPPVAEPNPEAPPFKPSMVVVDRTGARVGVVQSVTETTGGPNVVVSVDGKLVGVPPSTLKLQGETAVSSQTKAEILANAGAPR